MKKFLLLAVIVIFWLSACAAEQPVSVTETPAAGALAAPDASLATPAVGFVIVRRLEGMQSLVLRSQPDQESAPAGEVLPGENGKLLGFNAAKTWALVKFADQSGWTPISVLDLTIAE